MYRRLIDDHEAAESRFSRDLQLELANALYQRSKHDLAARAYEDFLRTEGDDDEAPMVRVLLARVLAQHLNEPGRAKDLLRQALLELRDPQLRELAQADLDALSSA
jgi:outer membrane protein assembly factor BamD (BamD/ComL family)